MFISCLPLFALNNRVVFFSFVLLEWSHLYTICQLGLVNVFLLPRKCSCCPAMTHMQMSERARGWVYLRRQMRAREKERDKERAIIHIFIFKKITMRRCNIDLLFRFLTVRPRPTVVYLKKTPKNKQPLDESQ